MQRQVSWMWMKARVCPPVPCTVRGIRWPLHEEAVQHGAVVAVIVEAVDQPLVQLRLRRLRAPDDALVQVRDLHAVVLVVEIEEQLILRLRHMVDGAGIDRIEISCSTWLPASVSSFTFR